MPLEAVFEAAVFEAATSRVLGRNCPAPRVAEIELHATNDTRDRSRNMEERDRERERETCWRMCEAMQGQ